MYVVSQLSSHITYYYNTAHNMLIANIRFIYFNRYMVYTILYKTKLKVINNIFEQIFISKKISNIVNVK